jgi:hypothetical protein
MRKVVKGESCGRNPIGPFEINFKEMRPDIFLEVTRKKVQMGKKGRVAPSSDSAAMKVFIGRFE